MGYIWGVWVDPKHRQQVTQVAVMPVPSSAAFAVYAQVGDTCTHFHGSSLNMR